MSYGHKLTQVPKHVTVGVDDREKYPVLFPATMMYYPKRDAEAGKLINIRTNRLRIGTGDYRLEEYKSVCLIERKGSIDELGQNLLTPDYGRFTKSLDRLVSECLYPVMFLDDSLPNFYKTSDRYPCPNVILDSLIRETTERNITLLWAGLLRGTKSRVLLGETLIRVMLSYALVQRDMDQEDILRKFGSRC